MTCPPAPPASPLASVAAGPCTATSASPSPTDIDIDAASAQRLFAVVEAELGLPAGTVHAATPTAALGDSLDWLELLMAVEDAFGVVLDPARTRSVATVADLMRLLPASAGDHLQAGVEASVQRTPGRMAGPRPRPG